MYALEKIKTEIAGKINEKLGREIVRASDLVYPPDAAMGDLSLPCFVLAKELKKNPAEVARELSSWQSEPDSAVATTSAAGAYLNFKLSQAYLVKAVISEIDRKKDKYGYNEIGAG